MARVLTADQFVASIIAMLAIRERKRFMLTDTEIDTRFEKAYQDLVRHQDEVGVVPNFRFHIDPFHGDSSCLRDTLFAAKEKELIAFNNPTLRTFDIKIDANRANRYLDKSPLPRAFIEGIFNRYFGDI